MAFYTAEEEVWKCIKHPSRRHRTGVCPVCLHERLASLCPECCHTRPCACSAIATTSSSSCSSSSSFSRFSVSGGEFRASGIGAVGRLSSLIDSEPAFRRSRSVTAPFLLQSNSNREVREEFESVRSEDKPRTFWSMFKASSSNKSKRSGNGECKNEDLEEEERRRMMRKSRSVAVVTSIPVGGESRGLAASKWRGWYFPSPIKVFKQSRVTKMINQEHSPLCRG